MLAAPLILLALVLRQQLDAQDAQALGGLNAQVDRRPARAHPLEPEDAHDDVFTDDEGLALASFQMEHGSLRGTWLGDGLDPADAGAPLLAPARPPAALALFEVVVRHAHGDELPAHEEMDAELRGHLVAR